MKTISVESAKQDLGALIDEVIKSDPVQIATDSNEAVLVSADDWRDIQETLYIQSIPGLKDSILEAAKAPPEEFSDEPLWK